MDVTEETGRSPESKILSPVFMLTVGVVLAIVAIATAASADTWREGQVVKYAACGVVCAMVSAAFILGAAILATRTRSSDR